MALLVNDTYFIGKNVSYGYLFDAQGKIRQGLLPFGLETTITSSSTNSNAAGAKAVYDVVDSTATTLNARIDNISTLGRFLSTWDCSTGLPDTNPTSLPYAYKSGDYYVVSKVGTSNLKPNGTSYTGTASSTAETGTVNPNDIYKYDGTTWSHLSIQSRDVLWGDIVGTLSLQTDLQTALNGKSDKVYESTLTYATATTYTLAANTYSMLDCSGAASGDAITFALGSSISGTYTEYMLELTTGANAPTITLPSGVTWYGGSTPTFNTNKTYQISIVRNLGVCTEF